MTDQDFRTLVAEMRHAQTEYFRTRSGDALSKSKSLERRVDQALKEFSSTQKEMFQ
jgi:hypothetical protein